MSGDGQNAPTSPCTGPATIESWWTTESGWSVVTYNGYLSPLRSRIPFFFVPSASPYRPSPSDRLVHRNERSRRRSVPLRQLTFCVEQRPLGIQHLQEIREPRFEPLLRQICRPSARPYRALENRQTRVRPIVRHKRSLALLEGLKDRRIVRGLRLILSGLRDLSPLSYSTYVEERKTHYRPDQQPGSAALEQRIGRRRRVTGTRR